MNNTDENSCEIIDMNNIAITALKCWWYKKTKHVHISQSIGRNMFMYFSKKESDSLLKYNVGHISQEKALNHILTRQRPLKFLYSTGFK